MDYNPRSPQNVGMEWVPIRQGNFTPDSFDEYGYIMRIDSSVTVVSGGIGIGSLPPQVVANIAEGVNIYPQLTAMKTGPVRMVTIPVQSTSITGTGIIVNGASGAAALANPMDNSFILFSGTSAVGTDAIGINFGVTAFANELNGKRIVKARLVYTAASSLAAGLTSMEVSITRKANKSEGFQYAGGLEGAVGNDSPLTLTTEFGYLDLGDWNPVWGPGITQFAGDTIFPWRYNELANLDTAALINVRQQLSIEADLAFVSGAPSVYLGYMALQVFYCEETRVGYGGRRQVSTAIATSDSSLSTGETRVPIRSTAYANSVTLTPGSYIITATHRAVSNFFTAKQAPVYAAIQQLNDEPPPVSGVVVKPTIVVDDPFASESTDVLTDLSLYSSVAAVTGCHVYASQIQAPVYGSITASQDVLPSVSLPANVNATQVRFYARRFATTTQPLKIALSGGSAAQSATITVDDFDALDEIFDGWREVTLTLGAVITMNPGVSFTMVWSSTGESAGSQWQVLGAQSFTTSPNVNVATYNPPSGGSAELTWKSPNATTATIDAQSDATIILAQDPPTVTSFTLSVLSQAVTGVAQECGVVPSNCIPTGISYVNMTWSPLAACDDFSRVVASGWSTTPQGQTWTQTAFTGTTSVNGAQGVAQHSAVNDPEFSTVDIGAVDQRITGSFSIPHSVTTGGALSEALVGRFTDTANHYGVTANFNTDNSVSVVIFKVVAGVGTALANISNVTSYSSNSKINAALTIVGSYLYVNVWNDDDVEPDTWMFVIQDTALTTGTRAGIRTRRETGNTNTAPVPIYTNDFSAMDARYGNGKIEIQRSDDLTDWQTIMLSDMCTASMRDFEARVGETSSYRIRTIDSLGFNGPWVTGSAALTAPGVTVSGSGVGTLIFTSNESPEGNLVYPMVWEGRAIETFAFPEADTQVFFRMYGRDYQVAFRPLERGGEQFDRVMLVQAAAIPVPSLANFGSLRDLAWQDLPYVCVRDELGNRWFANVAVPGGTVQRGRRIYLAQIRVTEVTDTAAPIT